MKIHFRYKKVLLLFMLLLPFLHSCTIQKRLYRPGFYVEMHQAKKVQREPEEVPAQTVQNVTQQPSATAETENHFSSSAEQPVSAGGPVTAAAPEKRTVSTGKEKHMPKHSVVVPKPLHKMIAKQKTWSKAQRAEGRGNTIKIIAGIAILVGLVIISIMIGDPLLIPKVLLIGSVVFFVIIGVAALCLLIYIINWLVDFVEGGCGL